MIDAILHVPDYTSFVSYLRTRYPDMLVCDEQGQFIDPPTVCGFDRTPAVLGDNEVIVYARFREVDADRWRGMAGVTVLAETPFVGEGTAQALYDAVFADTDKKAIYDRIYPRAAKAVEQEDGTTIEVEPPLWFGIMAGA